MLTFFPTFSLRLMLAALCGVASIVAVLVIGAGSVVAHNSLSSSEPATGAVLSIAPNEILWIFDGEVPLETMSVTLIDSRMVRSDLSGSRHGPGSLNEVITPLPQLGDGPVSVRWRLVSPDGHVISGRVDFTIAATTPVTESSLPGLLVEPGPIDDRGFGESSSTSSAVRWLLRYGSYAAIMAVVGILLTGALVWNGAREHELLRRISSGALLGVAMLAVVQLFVIASDVTGAAPWLSAGGVDAALTLNAGVALALRFVLALFLWMVIFRQNIVSSDVYRTAVGLPAVGLLATWAFAGHAGSLRWPVVGVVTDVIHHGAAALWFTGLAIVGLVIIPSQPMSVVAAAIRRFSHVAALCVGVLVITGLVQSVRLVGNPFDLWSAGHGRLLVLKLVAFGVMLALAQGNRQRLDRAGSDQRRLEGNIPALKRAVVAEFAVGLFIIGVTAAMVVSPPVITAV
jgi:copper transport protein